MNQIREEKSQLGLLDTGEKSESQFFLLVTEITVL